MEELNKEKNLLESALNDLLKEIQTLQELKKKIESNSKNIIGELYEIKKKEDEYRKLISEAMNKEEKLLEKKTNINQKLEKIDQKIQKIKKIEEELKDV